MNQSTINRYQPGGDIYASLVTQYGTDWANRIASAAQSGDNAQVNAALDSARNGGGAVDSSFWNILGNQLATDPLGAPLDAANRTLSNTALSFLRNPWVLFFVGLAVFGALGGFGWLGKKVFKP